jgi:WD40 repeat protein/serine/threonine protein kinase
MNEKPSHNPVTDEREVVLLAMALEKNGTEREAFLRALGAADSAVELRLRARLPGGPQGGDVSAKAAPLPGVPATVKLPTANVTKAEVVGQVIGHYKLLENVGEGGCGVVYVAEQTEPVRRRVALKVIKLGMDTKAVVARFEAERQALAMMDHPNIAKVLDAGSTGNGRPYFVMELVRGIRITDYCDQNCLSTQERLALFVQVCHAIQHAHQKGIIHRDIKPSNILVTLHDGVPVPKVIDFGIAKATEGRLTESTVYTQLHQLVGTPAYMSPEQAEMSGLDVDTRSDIYSLGVLLYELLTGRTPLDGEELASVGIDAMRRRLRETEPLRPSTRLAALGAEELTTTAKRRSADAPRLISLLKGDLDWVVMKCLEKDRTRRYATANGLASDLQRHLQHEPVVARPPSTVYRIEKFVRRNRVMVTAAAALVAVLVVAALVSTWQAVRASRLRVQAEVNEQRAVQARTEEAHQRQAAQEAQRQAEAEKLLARRQAYAADMNLAQRALAENDLGRARRLLNDHRPRPGEPDLRGWEWRYLWQGCRSDARGELCRYSNSVYSIAYSPDGNLLAMAGYIHGEQFVDLWDAPGRKQLMRLQEGQGHVVAFAPAGNLLATDAGAGQVRLRRAGATNVVAELSHNGEVVRLRFSADGRRLACLSVPSQATVWRVDDRSVLCRIPSVTIARAHIGALDFSPDGKALVIGDAGAQLRGRLQIFDVSTGMTNLSIPEAHTEPVTAVAWAPQGDLIASGSGFSSGQIRLWESRSGMPAGTLEGHSSWVCDLIFSADGQRLYSASADQTIRIWDVGQRRCLATLRGSNDEVFGLAISPDGKTLVSGAKDGAVAFWESQPRPERASPRLISMDRGSDPGFAPDSRVLAAVREGAVTLLDLVTSHEIERLPALGTNARIVAYSPDASLLASGARDGTIRVWSIPERRLLRESKNHEVAILSLKFGPDAAELLSLDAQGKAVRWDTHRWEPRASFVLAGRDLFAATFTPDGLRIVAGTAGAVQWFDGRTGALVAKTAGHRHEVQGLAFSRDGSQAASVALDGTVALWETASLKQLALFRGHMHGAHAVTFSPDGQRLVTGGGPGSDAVKLWDLSDPSTHRELMTLPGEGSLFYLVAFSPDGRWLAARESIGNRFQLWQAPSWAEIDAVEKAPVAVY